MGFLFYRTSLNPKYYKPSSDEFIGIPKQTSFVDPCSKSDYVHVGPTVKEMRHEGEVGLYMMKCGCCKNGIYIRKNDQIICNSCEDLWGNIEICPRCSNKDVTFFDFCGTCCNEVWDEREKAGKLELTLLEFFDASTKGSKS